MITTVNNKMGEDELIIFYIFNTILEENVLKRFQIFSNCRFFDIDAQKTIFFKTGNF